MEEGTDMSPSQEFKSFRYEDMSQDQTSPVTSSDPVTPRTSAGPSKKAGESSHVSSKASPSTASQKEEAKKAKKEAKKNLKERKLAHNEFMKNYPNLSNLFFDPALATAIQAANTVDKSFGPPISPGSPESKGPSSSLNALVSPGTPNQLKTPKLVDFPDHPVPPGSSYSSDRFRPSNTQESANPPGLSLSTMPGEDELFPSAEPSRSWKIAKMLNYIVKHDVSLENDGGELIVDSIAGRRYLDIALKSYAESALDMDEEPTKERSAEVEKEARTKDLIGKPFNWKNDDFFKKMAFSRKGKDEADDEGNKGGKETQLETGTGDDKDVGYVSPEKDKEDESLRAIKGLDDLDLGAPFRASVINREMVAERRRRRDRNVRYVIL